MGGGGFRGPNDNMFDSIKYISCHKDTTKSILEFRKKIGLLLNVNTMCHKGQKINETNKNEWYNRFIAFIVSFRSLMILEYWNGNESNFDILLSVSKLILPVKTEKEKRTYLVLFLLHIFGVFSDFGFQIRDWQNKEFFYGQLWNLPGIGTSIINP